MIVINNLEKSFTDNKKTTKVLNNINLEINDGEIFGLIGLSGAGKTTIIRSIAGLEKIDNGSIIINGRNIEDLKKNRKVFKKEIGIVFQGFNLLKQHTVFSNIAFPLIGEKLKKEEIEERVKSILSLVGLEDKINEYPSHLSGGQVQRVAIARALVSNPKILLLDEITSALDPSTKYQILNLLKDINKKLGVTMIIITHDMKVVDMICDRIAILYSGSIIESGLKDEIMNNPKTEIGKLLLKDGEYK